MTHNENLPPLPTCTLAANYKRGDGTRTNGVFYTAEQMREYAMAAIATLDGEWRANSEIAYMDKLKQSLSVDKMQPLPCPFCGGRSELETPYRFCFQVQCLDKDCTGRTPDKALRDEYAGYSTELEAIEAWNRRPVDSIARSPWRTIDSAPKDGTTVYMPHDLAGYWHAELQSWVQSGTGAKINPTHYMPIPAWPEVRP